MSKVRAATTFLLLTLFFSHAFAIFENPESVIMIDKPEVLQEVILQSDFLNVFIFCSEKVENCRLVEPVYKKFADNMKDFVRIYAVNCDQVAQNSAPSHFPLCLAENEQYLPYLVAYEPPAIKINPYTHQPSKPIEHSYQGNGDPQSLAAFARQHMPVFREIVKSKSDLETFLADESVPNKVILFTNKPQTSPLYRSLASEYRDRLSFAEINESSQDLIQEFQITKYPTLIVMKKEGDSYEKETYDYELTIDRLRRFLKSYALTEKADRPDNLKTSQGDSQEQQQQHYQERQREPEIKVARLSAQNFEEEVNKHERIVLIHLFNEETSPILTNVQEKFTRFFEYFDLDCTTEENQHFVRERLNVKSLPALVALPIGKEKKLSTRIVFPKTATLQEFTQEISDFVGDKVLPISSMEMQGVITNSLARRRPAFIMLYDTNDVSMTYRMLSQLSKYEDKLTFTKFKNPGPEMVKHFQLDKLPTLMAVLLAGDNPDDVDIDASKIQLAKYSGRYNYEDLTKYFNMFLPEEEILQEMSINKKVHQVQTRQELNQHCPPESRVCVIGLLNGDTSTPESSKKLEDNLAILNLALKKHPHLSFVWIDAICHSEALLAFNVQDEYVPTVVVYSPALKEYSQLVGTFDNPSIAVFLEKVLKKRVSAYPLPDGLPLEERNCSEIHEKLKQDDGGSGASADDDDIMKELMEEIKRKEAENAPEKKKKKKKKRFDDDL